MIFKSPVFSYLWLSFKEYLTATNGYLELILLSLSIILYPKTQETDFFYTMICLLSFSIANIINIRILSRQSGNFSGSIYSILGPSQIIKYLPILSAIITALLISPFIWRGSEHVEVIGTLRILLFTLTSTYLSTALLILTQGLKQTGGRNSSIPSILIGLLILFIIPLILFYIEHVRWASIFCLCHLEVVALFKFSLYFAFSLIMLKLALLVGHFDPEAHELPKL